MRQRHPARSLSVTGRQAGTEGRDRTQLPPGCGGLVASSAARVGVPHPSGGDPVGGVNPTIQPAAALDRRGVPATIDLDRLRVRIDTGDHTLITPVTKARKPGDYGQEWR